MLMLQGLRGHMMHRDNGWAVAHARPQMAFMRLPGLFNFFTIVIVAVEMMII